MEDGKTGSDEDLRIKLSWVNDDTDDADPDPSTQPRKAGRDEDLRTKLSWIEDDDDDIDATELRHQPASTERPSPSPTSGKLLGKLARMSSQTEPAARRRGDGEPSRLGAPGAPSTKEPGAASPEAEPSERPAWSFASPASDGDSPEATAEAHESERLTFPAFSREVPASFGEPEDRPELSSGEPTRATRPTRPSRRRPVKDDDVRVDEAAEPSGSGERSAARPAARRATKKRRVPLRAATRMPKPDDASDEAPVSAADAAASTSADPSVPASDGPPAPRLLDKRASRARIAPTDDPDTSTEELASPEPDDAPGNGWTSRFDETTAASPETTEPAVEPESDAATVEPESDAAKVDPEPEPAVEPESDAATVEPESDAAKVDPEPEPEPEPESDAAKVEPESDAAEVEPERELEPPKTDAAEPHPVDGADRASPVVAATDAARGDAGLEEVREHIAAAFDAVRELSNQLTPLVEQVATLTEEVRAYRRRVSLKARPPVITDEQIQQIVAGVLAGLEPSADRGRIVRRPPQAITSADLEAANSAVERAIQRAAAEVGGTRRPAGRDRGAATPADAAATPADANATLANPAIPADAVIPVMPASIGEAVPGIADQADDVPAPVLIPAPADPASDAAAPTDTAARDEDAAPDDTESATRSGPKRSARSASAPKAGGKRTKPLRAPGRSPGTTAPTVIDDPDPRDEHLRPEPQKSGTDMDQLSERLMLAVSNPAGQTSGKARRRHFKRT